MNSNSQGIWIKECRILVILCALAFLAPGSPLNADAARPNILIIFTDDQGYADMGCYGNTKNRTPRLDQLAKDGMVFDAAYHMGAWAGGVCTPSRHMIMSGRSVWHIPDQGKNRRNPHAGNPQLVPPNMAEFTMGAVFNRAGYATMRTCKVGNSFRAANE